MYNLATEEPYAESDIFANRTRLGFVDTFDYFESVV